MCGVYADGGVGGTRPAGDQTYAWFAGQFGVALGHESGAAFLSTDHESKIIAVAVQAIKHAEIALTGHAECGVDTVGNQGIGNQVATGTGGERGCCHACKLNQ